MASLGKHGGVADHVNIYIYVLSGKVIVALLQDADQKKRFYFRIRIIINIKPLISQAASKYLEMHTTLPPPVVSKTTPSTKQMEEDQMEDTSDEEVIWVQCDREECLKWRKLPHTYKISTTEDWYCDMHPDPIQKSCDIPEEKCKMSGKKFFTYSWFPAGQLVWAKMIGYPQ